MEKVKQQWENWIQFFKDVEVEARRISWPSVRETIRSTGAVIFISAILTAFIGLVDFLFSLIVKYILG
ncbi:MAG TPA: preprotein translocase subunit SecE [Thermodesulfobacteriota bacterium]|nr:preprotein translocase subunit SecE [Thermodesulfobacteriota bacterium]